MKTLKISLITLCLTFLFQAVNGQYTKGNIFLSGSSKIDFSSFNSNSGTGSGDYEKSSSFEVSPQIGAFVSDGIVIGGDLLFNRTTDTEMGWKTTSKSFGLAPFFRWYIGHSNSRPFLQFEAGLGSMSEGDNNYTQKYRMFIIEIDGGIDIYINSQILLELYAGYGYTKLNPTENSMESGFKINGFITGLGFVITI